MSSLFPDSLDDLIAEAEREVRMRERVYPRMIANGTLKEGIADTQLRRQRAIVARLKADKMAAIAGTG